MELALLGVEDDPGLPAKLEELPDHRDVAVTVGCVDVCIIQAAQDGVDDLGSVV